jgi:iron complex outermembrane receptor protein
MTTARRTLSTQLTAFFGSTSLVAVSSAMPAIAAEMVAQAEDIPETVLITGSLIRGTAAVGVPVTNLTPQDFAMTGALNTADLFRAFPAANVMPAGVATNSGATIERGVKVNIRGLDTGTATRSLLMVDGIRFPAQGNGQCIIDPSIIPALSQDHIDVLVDGASATYGSDAISGVINIILKRNMDGAITQLRWTAGEGGKNRYLASAVWGRTWDGGQVTISYEWYNDSHVAGNFNSMFGIDFRPWGFDDKRPLGSSLPGTLSTGPAAQPGGGPIGTGANTGSGCTNCYAVPLGAGQNWEAGASGVGPPARPIGQPNANPYGLNLIDWSTFGNAGNGGTNGVRNQFDPYHLGWYDANQQRNGGHITVDQRLTTNISFYGSAFYSNRRAFFVNPSNIGPSPNNALAGFAVPTFNPYYPINAPTNLRAYYSIGYESPPTTDAYELAQRYQLGLNIALPAGWSGRVWYAETKDSNYNHTDGSINKAAVSAALGWTIGVTPASGTTPAIATWAKPANIPYLNLFCDPLAYQCNSPTTLSYIQGVRLFDQDMKINEKGVNFDGPLFDLPGGTVKMAVGGNYTSYQFSFVQLSNTNASNLILPYALDPEKRAVWAAWTQLNVPIFSDQNGFFGMRRLELEFSWRHDQYNDVGGTSNSKVAFNWSPLNDFTVRGTWGSSFRAPVFGEISPLANVAITGRNMAALGLATDNQPIGGCTGANPLLPPAGSGAYKVLSSYGDGTIGSATSCLPANTSLTLPNGYVLTDPDNPYGITFLGGSAGAAIIRANGLKGWSGLTPELATNWGIGFDYTPSSNFLTGLSIQATYYIIKINSVLIGFGNPNSGSFNDPNIGDFAFLVPTDYAGDPNGAGCTNNLLPTTCAPFQDAVQSLIAHPRAQIDAAAKTLIMWINDGGVFNKGWIKMEGIDWQWSYDWDWGDIGAFNIGMTGTYYLHRRTQTVDGAEIVDDFHQTINRDLPNEAEGIATLPRMLYRARVGWSNGPWSATLFMDHRHHYYHTQSAPPNVNGNFCASNGGLDAYGGGGTFQCAIQDYTNLVPSYYTFDLSLGYNTLDMPANEYLRNIGVQLVVQNVFDKHSNFLYKGAAIAGGPCTCDPIYSNIGRQISVIVTKQW